MKQLLRYLLLCFVLSSVYCDKPSLKGAGIICPDSCLFSLDNAPGTIIKMDCFDRFAIMSKHPETQETIYGIPDNLDDKFQEIGKDVHFSGIFRANDLQPTFPDPSFSAETIFQMKVVEIR